MEINRNQYFMVGLILAALGLQFLMVESVVLTAETTSLLAQSTGHGTAHADEGGGLLDTDTPRVAFKKTVRTPPWIGPAMLSAGVVLIFTSLAMRSPD
ncbi:MAG: hypothetical protein HQ581_26955 [Planctomycetes bacterium]|nr:hypothetical protein [Planctomycetota bacterium]